MTTDFASAMEPGSGRDDKWHHLSAAATMERLDSGPAGLDQMQVRAHLEHYGPNRMPKARGRSTLRRLVAQFNNVLILVLVISGVLALLLEHQVDAAVIFGVVIINGVIGFIQEGRAEAAMAAIGKMLAQDAEVRRDGQWSNIPAEQLVPGDIVRIDEGDRIPADLRLIESHGLRVDQAALTGESVPVSKSPEPVEGEAALAERRSMAYSGTLVSGGQAIGVVVNTGARTEIGQISTMLGEVRQLTTPLIRQINQFARGLTLVLAIITVVVVAAGLLVHGMPLADGLLAGVALLVAAIPEGLPAVITITLAIGVQRMAAKNAVVRRLPAVETLGSVTVICTDKTGTLTRNRLQAERVAYGGGDVEAGQLDPDSPLLQRLLHAAVLCNNAEAIGDHGDPIERALIDLAAVAGCDVRALRERFPREALVPFSSSAKWMGSLHSEAWYIKGAPEVLIENCDTEQAADGDMELDRGAWKDRLNALARRGYRLLALADAAPEPEAASPGHLPQTLRLLGVVAFADPLRENAMEAIAACHAAGMRVKMITGDHPDTACAIARALGLKGAENVLTGNRLDTLDDEALSISAHDVDVFARTTSAHKLRLVKALQARGEIVSMTGDGANDAPALKRADIGVAMGIKGTEAAREASEMVLTDDNFATIVSGVEGGRGVYDNIRKAMVFLLPTSAAEALVIVLAVLAGATLPLSPVQVLWVNMVTAITLAVALGFEPPEADVMKRPPRDPAAALVTGYMTFRIVWVSLVLTAMVFWLFDHILAQTGDLPLARGVALNMLTAGEAVYLFNCRRWLRASWTFSALFSNPVVWISIAALAGLQLMVTYWKPLQQVFDLAPLAAGHWALIAAACLVLFALVEFEKLIFRRLGKAW